MEIKLTDLLQDLKQLEALSKLKLDKIQGTFYQRRFAPVHSHIKSAIRFLAGYIQEGGEV